VESQIEFWKNSTVKHARKLNYPEVLGNRDTEHGERQNHHYHSPNQLRRECPRVMSGLHMTVPAAAYSRKVDRIGG
jgi:hypothetical protein